VFHVEVDKTARLILILSLLSIPLAVVLSGYYPIIFLLVSVTWLVSPAFFVNDKPLFQLCLAQSLFFVTLYVRVLASASVSHFDPNNLVTLHFEQGLALIVLFLLAKRFYSTSMLRLSLQGVSRALVVGLMVGLPFGVVDYLSGEEIVTMPGLGLAWSFIWIVTISILVGLLEEILFRGVIYLPARNVVGARWGSLYQALLFSAVHYPNPLSALAAALLFGIVMVFLLQRTGNLFAPIVAHASNNVVWMMLGRIGGLPF
jgi:membrane protease YdiL (CAAX protease family)